MLVTQILKKNGKVTPNNSLLKHTIQFHGVQHAILKELYKISQRGQNLVQLANLPVGLSATHSLEPRSSST